MPAFKSLKKPLLSKEVESQLKLSILNRKYNVGQKLPSERELVDQFQVSRVTVREALRGLQQSGLVQIKRGREAGAYAREPDSTAITESFQNLIQMGKINFTHLIDARLYIEPWAAGIAALRHIEKDIEYLQALLDRAEDLTKTSCKQARLINVSFHSDVARLSRNPIIVFITESITHTYSEILIEKTKEQLKKDDVIKLINEHRQILKEIVSRNPAGAYQKTKIHLIETYKMYSRVMTEQLDGEINSLIMEDLDGLARLNSINQ